MTAALVISKNTALAARSQVERMTGIEPALSAWEADVLPLNYIRRAVPVAQQASTCTVLATCYRNEGLARTPSPKVAASQMAAQCRTRRPPACLDRKVLLPEG